MKRLAISLAVLAALAFPAAASAHVMPSWVGGQAVGEIFYDASKRAAQSNFYLTQLNGTCTRATFRERGRIHRHASGRRHLHLGRLHGHRVICQHVIETRLNPSGPALERCTARLGAQFNPGSPEAWRYADVSPVVETPDCPPFQSDPPPPVFPRSR